MFISEYCSSKVPSVQAINFCFTRSTKRLQPVTATLLFHVFAKILGYRVHSYIWGGKVKSSLLVILS